MCSVAPSGGGLEVVIASAATSPTITAMSWWRCQPASLSAVSRSPWSGSGTWIVGGSERARYQSTTVASASSSGTPGEPSGSTLLALPVNPRAARSTHPPSDSCSRGCQASAAIASSVPASMSDAERRRSGASGTTLAATTRLASTVTTSPVLLRIDHWGSGSSGADSRKPTTSRRAGPPLGPVPPAVSRTLTRRPMAAATQPESGHRGIGVGGSVLDTGDPLEAERAAVVNTMHGVIPRRSL